MNVVNWRVYLLLFVALASGCDRVKFDLTPQHFSECQGRRIIVHVNWHVPKRTADHINVYVNGVGLPETLWTSGGPNGEADTGKWMFDGSSLSLRDSDGVLLARRTVTTSPCRGPKPGKD